MMNSEMHISTGMGIGWIVVLAFLILGIAAFLKYLRSK